MAWNELKNKIKTITDKEGMFIKMVGSIMVPSLNLILSCYSGFTKNVKFT